MGSTVFPASSGGASAPYLGAGTTVVQTQQTKGWYTTTLTPGSYIAVVDGLTGGNAIFNQRYDYSSGTPTHGWSYSSYANSEGGNQQVGKPALIKVTTSDTYYFSWDWTYGVMPFTSYQGYNSYLRTDQYQSAYRYSSNADIDKYFTMGRNADSNWNAGRVYWVDTYAGNSTISNNIPYNYITNQTGRARLQMTGYFGNKYYVSFTESGYVWYSTDLVTWNQSTANVGSYVQNMAYANTTGITYYYAMVSDSGSATTSIASSTDGITWGARTSATGTNALYGICWGNGLWVAVGGAGQITTSTDTVTWSSRTSPQTANAYTAVVYQNGLYFAMQDYPTSTGVNAAVSTNGTTWTAVTMWASASAAADASTAANLGNYLAYIPENRINNSNSYYINNLFAGGGYFYFRNSQANGNQLWVSTNGTTWGTINLGPSIMSGYCSVNYSATHGQVIAHWNYNNGTINMVSPKPANISIYNSTIS